MNMETLVTMSNYLILGLILIAPILILIILKRLKAKQNLIIYTLLNLLLSGILILIFAWWSDESALILLKHYGYNLNGINEAELYENVLQENIEQVKNLEVSIMGIGWPVKAMFGYIMFIPYLILIYIGKIIIDKIKVIKTESNN